MLVVQSFRVMMTRKEGKHPTVRLPACQSVMRADLILLYNLRPCLEKLKLSAILAHISTRAHAKFLSFG